MVGDVVDGDVVDGDVEDGAVLGGVVVEVAVVDSAAVEGVVAATDSANDPGVGSEVVDVEPQPTTATLNTAAKIHGRRLFT